jgi:hypothetical protein
MKSIRTQWQLPAPQPAPGTARRAGARTLGYNWPGQAKGVLLAMHVRYLDKESSLLAQARLLRLGRKLDPVDFRLPYIVAEPSGEVLDLHTRR